MSKGNPYRNNRTKSKKNNKRNTDFKNRYNEYKEDEERKDLYIKKKQINRGW